MKKGYILFLLLIVYNKWTLSSYDTDTQVYIEILKSVAQKKRGK